MKHRIVEMQNGKYRVQSKVLFYWVNGIWDGERYLDYSYDSPELIIGKIHEIDDNRHKYDTKNVIGIL